MDEQRLAKRLLENMENMHELGRQKAFELGNPFYARFEEDGEYWRKELPTGERYLVLFEIKTDKNDMPVQIFDTFIKLIND